MLGVVGSVPVLPELTMLTLKDSPYLSQIMESLNGKRAETGLPEFSAICRVQEYKEYSVLGWQLSASVATVVNATAAPCVERRHQQSERGREAHRRCQRRYRERLTHLPVTDQGCAPITHPTPAEASVPSRCAFFGRHCRWIDPFPAVPRRLRARPTFKFLRF
jgi:hypothetical protein